MLLRLRQICSHASLVQEEGRAYVIGGDDDDENLDPAAKSELTRARTEVSPDFVARMKHIFREIAIQRIMAEKEVCCSPSYEGANLRVILQSVNATAEVDEECPICFDSFTAAVVTPCTHVFCRDCIGMSIALPEESNVY